MADKKVIRNIHNLAGLSVAELENDIEHLLFVDNEAMFPMTWYAELQPIVGDLAKLITWYADKAARKTQDELLYKIGEHLKEEVGNVVYKAKIPTTETLEIAETKVEVEEPTKEAAHRDW